MIGGGKKKQADEVDGGTSAADATGPYTPSTMGSLALLWQAETVRCYIKILESASNRLTLEASAGAIQNLAACYWPPSDQVRSIVRKEKGLPILVELLRVPSDELRRSVATALRNLALNQSNRDLIGRLSFLFSCDVEFLVNKTFR